MKKNIKRKIIDQLRKIGIFTQINVCLKKYTSFQIGGICSLFILPQSINETIKCLELCAFHDISPHILGGGTNLLITSDIAVVICTKKLSKINFIHNKITAECGVSLPFLVKNAVKKGLSLEYLAGIPGSIGGAIYGNAGTKNNKHTYSIGDYVEKIITWSTKDAVQTWSKNDLSFSYRQSNLQSHFILQVELNVPFSEEKFLQKQYNSFLKKKFLLNLMLVKVLVAHFAIYQHVVHGSLLNKKGFLNIL